MLIVMLHPHAHPAVWLQVGLPHVLAFLDEKRHLISGLPDAERPGLYERFVEVLAAQAPEALARARAKQQQQAARRHVGGDGRGEATGVHREGGLLASWQAVVGAVVGVGKEGQAKRPRVEGEKKEGGGGFSFGFAF